MELKIFPSRVGWVLWSMVGGVRNLFVCGSRTEVYSNRTGHLRGRILDLLSLN